MDYQYLLPEGRDFMPEEPVQPVPTRPWGGWATAGFGLVIFLVTLFAQVIVVVVLMVAFAATGEISLESIDAFMDFFQEYAGAIVAVSAIVNAIIGTALIWLIIKVRKGPGIRDYLGFHRVTWRTVLLSILVLALYLAVSFFIERWAGVPDAGTMDYDIYSTRYWPVLVWIALCIVGPLYEEIWIRGFLFTGFIGSRLGLVGTLVITSLFWAVQHIQYSIIPIIIIFFFGIVLGYVRYKSGSLWAPVIMHVLNNTISLALLTAGF